MVFAQVERTSSGTGAAGVHFATGRSTFLATNVTFRQSLCWPILLRREAATDETVLRNVLIEMPEGCDVATLQSANIASVDREVRTLGCSDTYTSAARLQVGVCSPNTLCVESTFAAEQLTGLHCACRAPAYPNPDLVPTYAPYEEADGCLAPTQMDTLTLTRKQVIVSLQKPLHPSERVNLTLDLKGTDKAEMTWDVSNAVELRSSATWLHLPTVSSRVPALPSGQAIDRVEIELELNAVGQRERAEAYTATLVFSIRSYAERREPRILEQEQEVHPSHAAPVDDTARL